MRPRPPSSRPAPPWYRRLAGFLPAGRETGFPYRLFKTQLCRTNPRKARRTYLQENGAVSDPNGLAKQTKLAKHRLSFEQTKNLPYYVLSLLYILYYCYIYNYIACRSRIMTAVDRSSRAMARLQMPVCVCVWRERERERERGRERERERVRERERERE